MKYVVESQVEDSSDDEFFLNASESSLVATWDNPDDDDYGELLECEADPLKP